MIRTIVIDDEPNSRSNILEMLRIYCANVEVAGQAEDVRSGLAAIKKLKPELVLLDIKMPDGTGFDLLRQLNEIDFKVIFITAYEEYAIKAFKFNAIDYLLKPIDPEELVQSIDKIEKTLNQESLNTKINKFLSFVDNPTKSVEGKKIILKTFENIYLVDIEDIISVESDQNYSRFFMKDGDVILVSRTIKEFCKILEEHAFYRVHQSYLINLNQIKMYNKEENICLMSDGSKIPVSYRKKEELLSLFKTLS